MKISIFFITFSIIFLLNSTFGRNFILDPSIDDNKLSKSICKITNDVISSKNDTQDILIGNLGGKVWSSTVNDIVQCIDDGKVVIVTDFGEKIVKKGLRKASVGILIGLNVTNDSVVTKVITNGLRSTVWDHMVKIICIVPDSSLKSQRVKVLSRFKKYGFLNVAMAYRAKNGSISYENLNFSGSKIRTVKNLKNNSLIFPDKLKNMEGFPYEVAVLNQPPLVKVNKGLVTSHMMHFLHAMTTIQNATIKFSLLPNATILQEYWKHRKMHLCLNSATVFNAQEPKLLIYEKKSYCALVPIPPKTSLVSILLIKPFDVLTWMLFMLSIVCSVAVWRMFRGRGAVDSHWQLACGIFMMFIGQSADFSRHNRLVLAILLNIICLSVFLLSNLYEGAITSSIIEPSQESRLKTVEDLLASSHQIRTDKTFVNNYRNSSEYETLKSRINMSGLQIDEQYLADATRQKHVFIRHCDVAKNILSRRIFNGKLVLDYYYILPERLLWQYTQLEASFWNPFLEKLQFYMDLSFQAGLHHMWRIFADQPYLRKPHPTADEAEYVKFEDLLQVFSILIIGYALSTLVLLIEIFYHDCLTNLKIQFITRHLRKCINKMAHKRVSRDTKHRRSALYYIIHRHQKIKRLTPKRLKVRQIFVQSKNRE